MAEWKKVVVSGSDAALNTLTLGGIAESSTALASPYAVVITGSNGELFVTSSAAIAGGGTTTANLIDGAGIQDFSFDGSVEKSVIFDSSSMAGPGLTAGPESGLSASVDDSTIGLDGSDQIGVKDLGIDTAQLANDAVTTIKLPDSTNTTDGVTFAKIQHAAANTVVVRDANTAGDLSAKTVLDEQILIGDGTGFTAAKLSGDVTMANDGEVTIATSLGALGVNSFTGSFTGSFSGDIPAGTLEKLKFRDTNPGLTFDDGSGNQFYDGGTEEKLGIKGIQDAAYQVVGSKRNVAFDQTTAGFIYTGTSYDSTSGTTTISNGDNSYSNVQLGPNNGTGTVTIPGDLVVSGTASFQNTQTLFVEDRYILLNSGSTSGDQGGIVIQTANSQNVGQLFGYNDGESRWGINTSFSALDTADFTANGFMGLVSGSTATNPNAANVTSTVMKEQGNIFISNNGSSDAEIWIYA